MIDLMRSVNEDGRRLKFMPVIDEYTRECLIIEVGRSVKAERVITVLEQLFARHGAPANLRSDNGPEFIAEALKSYLKEANVETRYIEPGAPWQNGYVESFNATLRSELLNLALFATRLEASVLCEQYRVRYNTYPVHYNTYPVRYNTYRPHSALEYMTPATFTAQARDQQANPNPEPALT